MRLPSLSTQPIWLLNFYSLVIKSGHFPDHKWACGLCFQLQELPLVLDNQLTWLKIKRGCGISLGAHILLGKLTFPTLSLPDVFTTQPLEPYDYAAYFSKVGLLLFLSGLVG